MAPQAPTQSIGSGPVTDSGLPAPDTITPLAMLLGFVAIAYATLSKKKHYITAIAGPSLVLTRVPPLGNMPGAARTSEHWTFPFTSPNSKVIDASIEHSNFTFDLELTNTSGSFLKIRSVTEPDSFPSGTYNLQPMKMKRRPAGGIARFQAPQL